MSDINLKAAIEAVLFAIGGAVEEGRLLAAIGTEEEPVNTKDFNKAVDELEKEYEDEDRGIRLLRLENKYQLCTKNEYFDILGRIVNMPKKHNLTDVLLETLAIVAYKQPVTRAEIEKIRGVSSVHAVNRLIEYSLICEVGRLDAPGHPILLGTTDDFLRCFGIASMDELPDISPEKIEDFRRQAEKEAGLETAEESKDKDNPDEDIPDEDILDEDLPDGDISDDDDDRAGDYGIEGFEVSDLDSDLDSDDE